MANNPALPAPRKATTAFIVIVPALAFFVFAAAQLPTLHHLVPSLQGFWSDRPGQMEVAPHAWISLFVVAVLHALPGMWNLQASLVMVSSLGAAFSLGLLFRAMQSDRWAVWESVLLLALVALQPLVVYLTVNANESIPFALAFGTLVYAANRLDVNGDVQSQMTFGLFLPLLALVRPEVAVFIPVLAFLVPLRDPGARRDIRAFAALFLVSILPTFLVLFSLYCLVSSLEASPVEFLRLYLEPVSSLVAAPGDMFEAQLYPMLYLTPLVGFMLGYVLFVGQGRRHMGGAFIALALPVMLCGANALFGWGVDFRMPAAVLVATGVSWIASTELQAKGRKGAIIALCLCAVLGWGAPLMHGADGLVAPVTQQHEVERPETDGLLRLAPQY
ncbi:hypothetical protein FHS78_000701 [Parvibaculum indicum]|uniref:hypothetical protein n=1 Tax=Parvibaculum indicum TaxID=562969 RepID=UPI00141E6BE8|nr:hypothetical protein [Parvibaculum indicum]NIJ40431.1 hypothetical protein [Parvibaculum indicum]